MDFRQPSAEVDSVTQSPEDTLKRLSIASDKPVAIQIKELKNDAITVHARVFASSVLFYDTKRTFRRWEF